MSTQKRNHQEYPYITPCDRRFPDYLKSIEHQPSILYFQGDISLLESPRRVAIVGTRTPTTSGIEECQFITEWFVSKGYTIISGLAMGIDTVSHTTCIKKKGKTIAVLPCGLDRIYPKSNQKFSESILDNGGLLLSEYPPQSVPKKYYFIQRDRIQSAISQGVIIIESEVKGGTMYTAEFSIKQKRVLGCILYDKGMDRDEVGGNRILIHSGKSIGLTRNGLWDFERRIQVGYDVNPEID